MINLLPKPQALKETSVAIKKKELNITTAFTDERLTKAVSKLPLSSDGIPVVFAIGAGGEGYTLTLTNASVSIEAEGAAGAFYAIQTLRQIFLNEDVCELTITDKPSFKQRGFYHDATRGKVAKVETYKELIDRMAFFKMNSLQLYVEHTFAFKEFGNNIEKTGYLTADEIRELDDYCYDNFIEFVPSLATFGHLFELLELDENRELRVLKNFEVNEIRWHDRMAHHTIDPTNPRSIELIKSLIDQYIQLFRTNKFNICCDETFDLINNCKGGEEEAHKLYVDFVVKIIEHLKSKGKTVMLWADILLKHPESVSRLPEDVILLNWNYHRYAKEDTVIALNKFGKKQILCPGTWSWSRFCEWLDEEVPNIINMVALAKKYNLEGILNTNWGDWGNPASIELAMFGMVLGASLSWNADDRLDGEFEDNVNALLYKNKNGLNYLRELNYIHSAVVNWNCFADVYSNLINENKLWTGDLPEAKAKSTLILAKDFIQRLSKEQWENDEYRQEMLIAAEGIAVIIELWSKFLPYDVERFTDTSVWLEKFSKKWLEKNKPSELYRIQDMFNFIESAK